MKSVKFIIEDTGHDLIAYNVPYKEPYREVEQKVQDVDIAMHFIRHKVNNEISE